MAKPPIRIKRSAVSGAIPTTAQLALGELAINTADGKVFLKKDDGVETIVEVGGGGAGYTAPALLALYEKTNTGVADSFDGTETRFQLRNTAGDLVSITSALNLAISVNGVIQKPNTGTPSSPFEGFYITANTGQGYDIVFDTAPTAGSDFFGVLAGTFTATAGTSGIKILDDISAAFNSSTTAFTLQYSGSTFTPEFPDAVVVSVGGVLQIPTDAYTISGSTITFTAAPPSGATFYALSFEIGNAASLNLVNSVSSTSTTDAATPNSVKTAYDLAFNALPKADATLDILTETGSDSIDLLTESLHFDGGTGLTASSYLNGVRFSLDDTTVTPGSYTLANITVDQQGRITAASSGTLPPSGVSLGLAIALG